MSTTQTKPVAEPSEPLEKRFDRLKSEWQGRTAHLSNPREIMAHSAMRTIVGMGEPAVPFILRELESGPSVLVWALPEIVGARPEFEGTVSAMTRHWLEWGRGRGLV